MPLTIPPPPPDDDELDREPIPEPTDEASASERVRARSFGELIDKVVAGRPPAAMSADDRALVEVATAIRAATGQVELAPARRQAIVEEALGRAIAHGRPAADAASPTSPAPAPTAPIPSVAPGGARRWRPSASRVAPWAVAATSTAVAAAAAIALWVGRPPEPSPAQIEAAAATAAIEKRLPLDQRSRPADALIGRIPRERSGEAAARVDAIYADRLAGFRERRLGRAARATDGARAPRRSR